MLINGCFEKKYVEYDRLIDNTGVDIVLKYINYHDTLCFVNEI
jgi:hypothetical protein